MGDKKSNPKSVRLSDKVLKYVSEFKTGEGFNEKFENIVLDYMESVPAREKRKKELDKEIESKLKKLRTVEDRISKLENLEFSIKNLVRSILGVNEQASKIPAVSQDEKNVQERTG